MKFESELMNETEVNREVEVEDSKAVINSTVEQVVDCDTFMDMFREKVNKQRTLSRKVRDMENQIEDLLDEKSEDMQVLHAVDQSQEQNQMTEEVQRGSAVNSVPSEAIETYVQLRKGKDQLENNRQQLNDVEEDILELEDAAKEIVDTYDSFEMPTNYEKAREDLEQRHGADTNE